MMTGSLYHPFDTLNILKCEDCSKLFLSQQKFRRKNGLDVFFIESFEVQVDKVRKKRRRRR